eukprot:8441341-Pyramimonas_sp.AAC.1
MPRETQDQGNCNTGNAAQCEIHGRDEEESDLPSKRGSSPSIERNEEYAQFHISPGPPHPYNPITD